MCICFFVRFSYLHNLKLKHNFFSRFPYGQDLYKFIKFEYFEKNKCIIRAQMSLSKAVVKWLSISIELQKMNDIITLILCLIVSIEFRQLFKMTWWHISFSIMINVHTQPSTVPRQSSFHPVADFTSKVISFSILHLWSLQTEIYEFA